MSIVTAAVYEFILASGLGDFILSAKRESSIWSQNREGLCGIAGLTVIHCIGVAAGALLETAQSRRTGLLLVVSIVLVSWAYLLLGNFAFPHASMFKPSRRMVCPKLPKETTFSDTDCTEQLCICNLDCCHQRSCYAGSRNPALRHSRRSFGLNIRPFCEMTRQTHWYAQSRLLSGLADRAMVVFLLV